MHDSLFLFNAHPLFLFLYFVDFVSIQCPIPLFLVIYFLNSPFQASNMQLNAQHGEWHKEHYVCVCVCRRLCKSMCGWLYFSCLHMCTISHEASNISTKTPTSCTAWIEICLRNKINVGAGYVCISSCICVYVPVLVILCYINTAKCSLSWFSPFLLHFIHVGLCPWVECQAIETLTSSRSTVNTDIFWGLVISVQLTIIFSDKPENLNVENNGCDPDVAEEEGSNGSCLSLKT